MVTYENDTGWQVLQSPLGTTCSCFLTKVTLEQN